MGIILHITTEHDWKQAFSIGSYRPPSLSSEGFIHCSTIEQTVETANLFYRGRAGLVILCIDEELVEGEVRYESPAGRTVADGRGDELFPHLYGPLDVHSVVRVVDFTPASDGSFGLPPEIVARR